MAVGEGIVWRCVVVAVVVVMEVGGGEEGGESCQHFVNV